MCARAFTHPRGCARRDMALVREDAINYDGATLQIKFPMRFRRARRDRLLFCTDILDAILNSEWIARYSNRPAALLITMHRIILERHATSILHHYSELLLKSEDSERACLRFSKKNSKLIANFAVHCMRYYSPEEDTKSFSWQHFLHFISSPSICRIEI